ncbi:hypothetical protein DEO72_LG9g2067 [Vigna unguiculata]|uniref:Uncharacterized protein n=1 Tax=Vigna unguiculata TaxID=3917 RepID=A0A4D6N2G8_VIGUN|nr:hypothetical protein DEO72_LG9g2067 [Vigna unguiculata]
MVSTSFLAQASVSHLGEINRGSPRPFYESCRSSDQPYFERADVSLRRGESRLSENEQKAIVPDCRALA